MSSAAKASRSERGTRRRRDLIRAAVLCIPLLSGAAADPVPDWLQIAAIFDARCVMCHSRDAASRGLRLDSYADAVAGGETGPVLIPGDPAASELIRRLNGESRPRMPFLSYPLTAEEIDLISRWIAAGLPEGAPTTARAGRD